MIRTSYDPQADALMVSFGPENKRSDGAEEVAPGIFIHFDVNGDATDVEVLYVAARAGQQPGVALPASEPFGAVEQQAAEPDREHVAGD